MTKKEDSNISKIIKDAEKIIRDSYNNTKKIKTKSPLFKIKEYEKEKKFTLKSNKFISKYFKRLWNSWRNSFFIKLFLIIAIVIFFSFFDYSMLKNPDFRLNALFIVIYLIGAILIEYFALRKHKLLTEDTFKFQVFFLAFMFFSYLAFNESIISSELIILFATLILTLINIGYVYYEMVEKKKRFKGVPIKIMILLFFIGVFPIIFFFTDLMMVAFFTAFLEYTILVLLIGRRK